MLHSDDLMKGLLGVMENIKTKNSIIKKVLRVKNLFISNQVRAAKRLDIAKKDLTYEDWLYDYGDIKLNVMVTVDGMSLICEVQFLYVIHLLAIHILVQAVYILVRLIDCVCVFCFFFVIDSKIKGYVGLQALYVTVSVGMNKSHNMLV